MTSQQIETFLQFLRDCEQQHSMAVAEEMDAGNETQDILHSLELDEHSYHEYARLSKQLVEIRQRRRRAKDTIAVITPVLAFVEGNRPFIKALERLLGDVRKAEKRLENRVYIPRKKGQKE